MAKLIANFLGGCISKEHHWKLELFKNWEKIIGPYKDKVRIEKIDNNLLILGVYHPVWAQEFHLLSEVLRKKVNSIFSKERIKQIKIKFVSQTKHKCRDNPVVNFNNTSFDFDFDNINLSPLEKENLKVVEDCELRESLEKFFICCKRGEKCKKG